MRLRRRLHQFTLRWWSPVVVEPDQFDVAVVDRGRGSEAVITRRMRGIRPEQLGTSGHE
jgi:hypothetical protein